MAVTKPLEDIISEQALIVSEQIEAGSNVRPDKAFEVAKPWLQEQIKELIGDWDEDVSLLNVAALMVRQ